MRIPPVIYGVLVIVIFFGTILGFQSAGIWSISGKITSSGEAVQPSASDLNSIKGWMTLEQISTTFQVPLADILTQFDLPPDTAPSTAIKDLESEVFSVTNLRDWLQSRIDGVQPLPSEGSLPTSTPEIVSTPTLTPVTPAVPAVTPLPTEHIAPLKTITGKTTFGEILEWGVPKEAIEKIIGASMPTPQLVIKDYLTQQGMEFSSVKSALQAEVDKTK